MLFLKFKRFFNILNCIYMFVLVFLCALSYAYYLVHVNDVKKTLKNEARHIASTMEEIFDFSGQLIVYLSEKIAAAGTNDPHIIAEIIGKDISDNDSLSWLNIGWINDKNMFVFDRKIGFLTPPYNLSHRPYVQDCRRAPGKFFTSQVVIGASVGIRKIPGGIGIVNHQGHYLGILCVGFKLVDLNYKVQQKLSMANFDDTNVSYVVLDKDFHIVIQSPDNKTDIESSYYRDHLENVSIFSNDEGILIKPLTYKDITYTSSKKLKYFPYYVLTGINQKVSFFYFLGKLCPIFITFIIIGVALALLLQSNRRQFLRQAAMSQKARFNFLKEVRSVGKDSLNSILVFSDILSKTLKKEIDVGVTVGKQLDLLSKIHEEACNLYDHTTDIMNFSEVDVNSVIEECVLVQSQTALLQDIKIKTSLYPYLPLLSADKLRLKQIILGLISLSLEYSPKKSLIKISTSLQNMNNQDFLELVIEDNGFALGQEELHRMQERLEKEAIGNDMHFDFKAIEKLVLLHQGTIHVKSQWHHGKKITLTFSYMKAALDEKKKNEHTMPFIPSKWLNEINKP